MSGQLDGNFRPGSLPHKFILIVILIICFVVNKFIFLSLCPTERYRRYYHFDCNIDYLLCGE